jgi:hypothetical protein
VWYRGSIAQAGRNRCERPRGTADYSPDPAVASVRQNDPTTT